MKIVVKVGTSTLAYPTGHINIRRVESLCKVLADIANAGNDVILVTSGAIGMGMGKLSLSKRPDDIASKQAAAAVGQCELMYIYDKLFGEYNRIVAQILLTGNIVHDAESLSNFRAMMARLLEMHVIPIINENDSVATAEIKIGDNDTLSAIVAQSIGADLLVLMSDIDGLYTADPRRDPNAKLISEVRELTPDILALGEGAGSSLGTGGMQTKLHAAQICMGAGCDMRIVNGSEPTILYGIMDGEAPGTLFVGGK
ncbi:MAG: glutamate 5-kinase [Oscillospiraceae bacterium]|nr:glutamate 5-kinase [Oscillospiraceae bacterium]